MPAPTPQAIGEMIHSVAEAHHQAFIETDGADPDWPIWYSEHLVDNLNAALGTSMTKSELIYLLISAEREQFARAPGANWPVYYGRFFTERYGA